VRRSWIKRLITIARKRTWSIRFILSLALSKSRIIIIATRVIAIS
jgi:hypothetical protein